MVADLAQDINAGQGLALTRQDLGHIIAAQVRPAAAPLRAMQAMTCHVSDATIDMQVAAITAQSPGPLVRANTPPAYSLQSSVTVRQNCHAKHQPDMPVAVLTHARSLSSDFDACVHIYSQRAHSVTCPAHL